MDSRFRGNDDGFYRIALSCLYYVTSKPFEMTVMLISPPTLFALASAPGRAGVAVMRISGPDARVVFQKLCVPTSLPAPRTATLRTLVGTDGAVVDRALVLWFPAPHSFTGEDVVELHLHGGRAVVNAVTEALRALPSLRVADPGAFTRRAFENGKLDLTEAEALADLVNAETAAQHRQALRQMDGELGRLYRGWAERLTHALAHTEAAIDFVDEDLPPDLTAQRLNDARVLLGEIAAHLDDHRRGERLREGFTIAILGPPNAGKSSLLNALARREAAIVAPEPGTTRDVIEVSLDLGGYPVTLADTAGLRESADRVESEGIRRALARAEQADLKLIVFDGATWPQRDAATQALIDDKSVVLVNKADLLKTPAAILAISAKTGQGLEELHARLTRELDHRFAPTGQPSLTRARHREALEDCRAHLTRALAAPETDLCAEDLRLATRALGRITGHVDVEDLLDVIFRDFCVGK